MLNFAIQTARDAGAILSDRLGECFSIKQGRYRSRHRGGPCFGETDHRTDQVLLPRHAILAEESGDTHVVAGASDWKWIVDPLDGTTNYAHGYPCFCVSIALERAGAIEIAVIYDPTRDELFAAERGQGATLNDRRIRVSDVEELNSAMLCTGFPYNVRDVLTLRATSQISPWSRKRSDATVPRQSIWLTSLAGVSMVFGKMA